MPVILHLRVVDGQVIPTVEGKGLASPTPLNDLPDLETVRRSPYAHGQALFHALGGEALRERLDADPDGLLLLQVDEAAETVPWEFAALPDEKTLLAVRYGLLRLVDRAAPPQPASQALHFVALAADPLVDRQGNPREGYRLGFRTELAAIRRVLEGRGKAALAERIPPTRKHLRQALRRGPAWLHVTAHGDVIQTDRGPVAVLLLEDEDGKEERLLGPDLVRMAPRGVLRLVLLSACRTAAGVDQARLARALVHNGVPAAVGMQGLFPDLGSGPLAEALYDSLLADLSLAEAVRQARLTLLQDLGEAVAGLPVAYVARDAWGPLAIPEGQPDVRGLVELGRAALPPEVQPPEVLQGRNRELHDVARLFSQGARVVTLIGAGGMGKTALAAAFARRFAWRWPQGVLALSFAAEERLDAGAFRRELLRGLLGEQQAARLAEAPADSQEKAILDALRGWQGLLLVDNYESVLQALDAADGQPQEEAEAIHRLLYRSAEGGQPLLLTSREHPAGFPGEVTYPRDRALWGLSPEAGAALFLTHSARADGEKPEHAQLALDVARATEGHPLAIILLAGEFDTSLEVSPKDFLAHWPQELAAARRPGLAPHHVTFAAAFERSYRRLSPALQERLRLLSVFAFPFLAEAAAFAWGLVDEKGNPDGDAARGNLARLTRASLLEVDATFAGSDRPASYRFLPAVREEVAARLGEEERARAREGYAAYGAWLIDLAYRQFEYNPGLARLARLSMDALDAGFAAQQGVERLWKGWRLAWLKRTFGQVSEALQVLGDVMPTEPPDPRKDPDMARAYSRLAHEMAYIYRVRGDLDQAMRLYQDALAIDEALGDQKGKSATLHEMAYIYRVRVDLDQAMRLYQDALAILEALGDQKGKSATLHAMAYIYVLRGDLDQAMRLYQESLRIKEALGDQQGKSATLHAMAYIYVLRGDLDQAMRLYQESLRIKEALGDVQGKAMTLGMMGQAFFAAGRQAEGTRALLQGYLILVEAGIEPQTQQAMASDLIDFRRRAGAAVFDPIWAELTDNAPLPDWLAQATGVTQASPQAAAQADAEAGIAIPLDALPAEVREALAAAIAKAQAEGRDLTPEDLPPEVRQALEQVARQLARAAEDPQQALVDQVREAVLAARAGRVDKADLVAQLEELVARIEANEPEDSPWREAAQFARAAIALLKGEPPPPVPARYADEWSALL